MAVAAAAAAAIARKAARGRESIEVVLAVWAIHVI